MYEKLEAIVLHTVKYSDKNSIVSLFSKERGRISLLLPQGLGKLAKLRRAMFLPLSIVEVDANIMPGRDIFKIREARTIEPLHDIHINPYKNAIAMFIAELLGRVIQGSEDNRGLFNYLSVSIRLLDSIDEGVANFHICFLYKLGSFLGIQPDTQTYFSGYAFDMEGGVFVPFVRRSATILTPEEAGVLMLIDRMTFANMNKFKFNRSQRNELLELILRYYKLHNSTLGAMKSPDVLMHLFE
ncbi:MAG: DNA repair protein RecO [Muribaculaceae bacterium]|nr:DNA repair protein RecO [Muribaculaceae bacterium]